MNINTFLQCKPWFHSRVTAFPWVQPTASLTPAPNCNMPYRVNTRPSPTPPPPPPPPSRHTFILTHCQYLQTMSELYTTFTILAYFRPTQYTQGLLGLISIHKAYWAYTRPTWRSSGQLDRVQAYWVYPMPIPDLLGLSQAYWAY